MGILKSLFLLSGVPVRPTTTRERSRQYQRRANALAEEQNSLMEQQLAMQEQELAERLAQNERVQQRLNRVSNNKQTTSKNKKTTSKTSGGLEKLERLADLHSKGVLTDEEFESQKQIILKRLTTE